MGVKAPALDPNTPLPPGAEQDAVLRRVAGELEDKGFVVAQLDKLAGWAPLRFALAHDVRPGLLCGGNDAHRL